MKAEGLVDLEGTQGSNLRYVLITPARNEAAFIEETIKSVVGQTVLPAKWVIVSDGSTDQTDEIVKRYVTEYRWIELVRVLEREERHFAGKVAAFNAGYARVKDLNYDVIGSLDADITFEADYMSFLLDKFAENPELGVAGTPFVEGSFQYNYAFVNIEHVSGACQLFRRACFEEVGGYIPIKGGGIDWVAVTTARMRGWKTRTFVERKCLHHRKIGTGKSGLLASRLRVGQQDYYLGGHPLWEIFRSLYQMRFRPYIAGGLFILVGYVWAFLKGVNRPISEELVSFRRREQMQRLRNFFLRAIGRERRADSTRGAVHGEKPSSGP
jgi:biofilm PGA synthesis N-glycosyltransferase PgaC